MKRRNFLGVLGGMAAVPVVAKAEPIAEQDMQAAYEAGGTPDVVIFQDEQALEDFNRAAFAQGLDEFRATWKRLCSVR